MESSKNRKDRNADEETLTPGPWREAVITIVENLRNRAIANPLRLASEQELDWNRHIPVIQPMAIGRYGLGRECAVESWTRSLDEILRNSTDAAEGMASYSACFSVCLNESERDSRSLWFDERTAFETKAEEIAQKLGKPLAEFLEPFWEIEGRNGSRHLFNFSQGSYEVMEPKYFGAFYFRLVDSDSVLLVGLSVTDSARRFRSSPRLHPEAFLDSTLLLLMKFILWRSSKSKRNKALVGRFVGPIEVMAVGCDLENASDGDPYGRYRQARHHRTGQGNGQNRSKEIERAKEGRGREEGPGLVYLFPQTYGG